MPYILSPIVSKELKGLWGEGAPYESTVIYDICDPSEKSPPIHYESHTLKPHSLPHLDAPGHIIEHGKTVDTYFKEKNFKPFYGKVTVVRLGGNHYRPLDSNPALSVWRVNETELKAAISKVTDKVPNRLLITTDPYPEDENGNHDSTQALVLDESAALWLTRSNPAFCLYGTSWKSTDFQPGSKDRPIHKIIFDHGAAIFECLDLKSVPAGIYYWFAFPLPLEGATEAPVCPILLTEQEFLELQEE
jgi:arylformamidase